MGIGQKREADQQKESRDTSERNPNHGAIRICEPCHWLMKITCQTGELSGPQASECGVVRVYTVRARTG